MPTPPQYPDRFQVRRGAQRQRYHAQRRRAKFLSRSSLRPRPVSTVATRQRTPPDRTPGAEAAATGSNRAPTCAANPLPPPRLEGERITVHGTFLSPARVEGSSSIPHLASVFHRSPLHSAVVRRSQSSHPGRLPLCAVIRCRMEPSSSHCS
jgi:hypothetical protein